MSNNTVVLATYTFSTEAYPLKLKLLSEGIECYLENEQMVDIHPGITNAIGGVRLIVKESDLPRALELKLLTSEELDNEEEQ